jgi:hypothetical protein
MMNRMLQSRVFARRRTLHFVVLGALVFAAHSLIGDPDPMTRERPVVSAASAGEADEEILLREALAYGFDRQDKVVRERLQALGRDLALAPEDDAVALERAARSLGLHHSDPLIRRHLADMMRLVAAKPMPDDIPTAVEQQAYLDTHAAAFALPARLTLTHVYLSRERRGAGVAADARAMLADLRTRNIDPATAATAFGDPFVRGSQLRGVSQATLARSFGAAFAAGVLAQPEGSWAGPVESPFGLHLVYVEQRKPSAAASLAAVRARIIHSLLRERAEARLNARLAQLRQRYEVHLPAAAGNDRS